MFSFSSPAQWHCLGTGSTGKRLRGRPIATLKETLIVNTAWRETLQLAFGSKQAPLSAP